MTPLTAALTRHRPLHPHTSSGTPPTEADFGAPTPSSAHRRCDECADPARGAQRGFHQATVSRTTLASFCELIFGGRRNAHGPVTVPHLWVWRNGGLKGPARRRGPMWLSNESPALCQDELAGLALTLAVCYAVCSGIFSLCEAACCSHSLHIPQ